MKIPSPDSWVHKQPGGVADGRIADDGIGTKEERARAQKLQRIIDEKIDRENQRPRKDRFLPYLLVRAQAGDHGDRPWPGVFWESPDIWVAPGAPSATPEIPPSPGGSVFAGQPTTVYAHLWNLGLAPIAGVVVEFYWFDPSLVIDAAHAHLIGVARVDLGPRTSHACHRLVKCPTAWTPVMENHGHECLIVRVHAVGDDIQPGSWSPVDDRRVGQRNMSVVGPDEDTRKLISSLEETRREGKVELIQVGPEDAPPLVLLDRRLRVDPKIETRVLAELTRDGRVVARQPLDGRRVVTSDLLRRHRRDPGDAAAAPTGIHALLDHPRTLPAELRPLLIRAARPAGAFVQVLRVVNFDDRRRMIGGYTLVLRG